MIRQIHINECHSTQDVLKEQLKVSPSDSLLVSCENQISGRGRGENQWVSMPGSLCFSLNLSPHPVVSFTAIEIAVILTDFFKKKGIELKLKWPNDLWTYDQKKCGGILVQGTQEQFMAGIGLNIYSHDDIFGGIYEDERPLNKKDLAFEIAHFLQSNRIPTSEEVKVKWTKCCGHNLKRVQISEGSETTEGTFLGLGSFGEAIISTLEGDKSIFNGSLRLI
jgi:BirA family biotin operon repressor/biotin-[acetyl-CoA-carboxylase] ligase